MLTNPTADRRLAGRLTVLAALAVALPLTATRAIEYVDKVVPPVRQAAAGAPVASLAAVAQPALPATPAPVEPPLAVDPVKSIDIHDGIVIMDGQRKKWSELTPEEKAHIRDAIAEARRELAEHRIDREEIQRQVEEALAEADADRDELQVELAEARADIDRAMAEIDAHADDIRRAGANPEQLKASIRSSLAAVQNIDVAKIRRDALASIDRAQIEKSVAAAEKAIEHAEDELDRIEDLDRGD